MNVNQTYWDGFYHPAHKQLTLMTHRAGFFTQLVSYSQLTAHKNLTLMHVTKPATNKTENMMHSDA